MAFIQTISLEEATGDLRELYDDDMNKYGYAA